MKMFSSVSKSVQTPEETISHLHDIKSRRTFLAIKSETNLIINSSLTPKETDPEKLALLRRYKNLKLSEILNDKKRKAVFKNFSEKEQ